MPRLKQTRGPLGYRPDGRSTHPTTPRLRLALASGAWHSNGDMREKFRVWAEGIFTFGQEVIFEERRGKRAAVVRGMLFGLSKVYGILIKVWRFLINACIFRDSTLNVQIIAVDNLT